MNKKWMLQLVILLLLSILVASVNHAKAGQNISQAVAQGKYLIMIAGCNDCHTPGYLLSEGKVTEDKWLTGDSFGWRGPWGTTYPPNLRLLLKDLSEEEWLEMARTLRARPPMPWFDLNIMKVEDLRDIYRYIRRSGLAGSPAPAYVPPDREPPPPYALFPSPPPKK